MDKNRVHEVLNNSKGAYKVGVQAVAHEIRLQEWRKIIKECRNSGKSRAAWCNENNINIKTYYRWQTIIGKEASQQLTDCNERNLNPLERAARPVFAKISMPESSYEKVAIRICHNGADMKIYSGADSKIIEAAMRALMGIC